MFADWFIQIEWFFVFVAFFGAFLLYVLSKNNAKEPFSVLKALNIKITTESAPTLVLADVVLTSGIGGFGVCILATPQNCAQAFIAGLGFIGIILAFECPNKRR